MSLSFLLILLLAGFLLFAATVTFSDDPTAIIYSSCSQSTYLPNSPYDFNLDTLFSSLGAASQFSLYSQFTTAASPPPVSGLYQCRGDLSISRCSSCVRSAISGIRSLCQFTATASIQLDGCFLRYGNDTFLNRPDTKLRYKTCSTAGNAGGDQFLAARDQAFVTLASTPPSGSSYRVALTQAGNVRAQAQCSGDLSLRDCDDCVRAAAAQVKVSCGGAASGEVYLGKCFIMYSSGVYGSPAVGVGSGGGNNNDDSAGKTAAIMAGILAVVIFIIICFVYFKRKLEAGGSTIYLGVWRRSKG